MGISMSVGRHASTYLRTQNLSIFLLRKYIALFQSDRHNNSRGKDTQISDSNVEYRIFDDWSIEFHS